MLSVTMLSAYAIVTLDKLSTVLDGGLVNWQKTEFVRICPVMLSWLF